MSSFLMFLITTRLFIVKNKYFKCTSFRDFREFWPFLQKFLLLKILNRPIRESLCSRKKLFKRRFAFLKLCNLKCQNTNFTKICIKSIDFNYLISLLFVNTETQVYARENFVFMS